MSQRMVVSLTVIENQDKDFFEREDDEFGF